MRKPEICAAVAVIMGGALLLLAPGAAPAIAFPVHAGAGPADASPIEHVDNHKRRDRDRRRDRHRRDDRRHYDARRHGSRYRHAAPGFGYYYDGYYYGSPWWIGPSLGITVTVPQVPVGSAHVRWCLDHFRTYDVASDTYLGFDGYRHRCNSPFP